MEETTMEQGAAPAVPAADADLAGRVETLERELREAQRSARDARVRAGVHRALAGAAPVDPDAVALVVEAALAGAGAEPDAPAISRAVDEVRRTRPALFKPPAPARSPALTARVERAPADPLADAAQQARRTGDSTSLMQYLRLRRTR